MSIAPDDAKLLRTLSDQTIRLENVAADLADRLRGFEDAGLVRAVRSDGRSYMVLTGSGIVASRFSRASSRRTVARREAFEAAKRFEPVREEALEAVPA